METFGCNYFRRVQPARPFLWWDGRETDFRPNTTNFVLRAFQPITDDFRLNPLLNSFRLPAVLEASSSQQTPLQANQLQWCISLDWTILVDAHTNLSSRRNIYRIQPYSPAKLQIESCRRRGKKLSYTVQVRSCTETSYIHMSMHYN